MKKNQGVDNGDRRDEERDGSGVKGRTEQILRGNGIDKRIGRKEVRGCDEEEKKGTGPGWNK
ncbi:hypothetical protein V1478_005541 [Vespula squamosa]|uniref:Uncharacterized protein n=1 Tax=Vespula squamosa TaxID=30214 RepID=A0ABD2BAS3_VESSQ